MEADFGACLTPELRSLLTLSFHHVTSGKWAPGPCAYRAAKVVGWPVKVSLREALQGTRAVRAGFAREVSLGDIQERVCALLGRAPGSVAWASGSVHGSVAGLPDLWLGLPGPWLGLPDS